MKFFKHLKVIFLKLAVLFNKLINKVVLYIEKFKENPIRSLEDIYLKIKNADNNLQTVMECYPNLDLTNLIMLAAWANNCPELCGAIIVGQGERKKNNHVFCRLYNEEAGEETSINDFRYGFEKFSKCGCEVAATYNTMRLLGIEDVSLKSVGEYFISHNAPVFMGYLGTNPYAIGDYFNEMSIPFDRIADTDFGFLSDTDLFGVGDIAIISVYLDGEKLSAVTNIKLENDIDVFKIHTYAIKRISGEYVLTYNYYDSDTCPKLIRLNELLKAGEKFMVGYVFHVDKIKKLTA